MFCRRDGVILLFGRKANIFKKNKYFRDGEFLVVCGVFCVFSIFADQFIKYLIVNNLLLQESVVVINNIFKLTYVKNYGAAFSILLNQTLFLILSTLSIMFGFVFYIFKKNVKDRVYIFSISMIVAVGLGNLLDRLFRGFVVDYINLCFWPFYMFAVFNFADCLVVVGSFLFMFRFVKNEFFKKNVRKIKRL